MQNESKTRIGRLHVLTDFHFQQRYAQAELARQAIIGGADTIQFRQKHGTLRNRLHEAQAVAEACHAAGVPLIVDDYIDLALAVGAAGVHLGQEDFPIDQARSITPNGFIIGATVTNVGQAHAAEDAGADYLGFGPVYPTQSKDNPASVKGLDGLTEVCQAVTIPVIGIAGITADRIPAVLAAGAYGVAVMTAVSCARDPVIATRSLQQAFQMAGQYADVQWVIKGTR